MSRPEVTSRVGLSRRSFARILAAGGSATLFSSCQATPGAPPVLSPKPDQLDEEYWKKVRSQFAMPPDIAVMNAANLCPASIPVIETMYEYTRDMDRDPSHQNRGKFGKGKEEVRRLLAGYLRVSPEEIVITRNTSEGNNLVSSGIDLAEGDEVVIFSENHPSNNAAWKEKAARFGFTVREVSPVRPHPGAEYYIEAFTKAMTSRTKVLAFTHVTNTVGDQLPARELCRIARERDVLTLIDGAQTLGLFDLDLGDMQPDFFTGSAHKWPCGPKEVGILYVNKLAHAKIWPSVVSIGGGRVGISRKLERLGQRNGPAILALGEAIRLQQKIGMKTIEMRSRQLARAIMVGVQKIDGVELVTDPHPDRSAAVVVFRTPSLDSRKLYAALYENERIGGAPRGGGLRLSPHFYNLMSEVDRALEGVARYVRQGL